MKWVNTDVFMLVYDIVVSVLSPALKAPPDPPFLVLCIEQLLPPQVTGVISFVSLGIQFIEQFSSSLLGCFLSLEF